MYTMISMYVAAKVIDIILYEQSINAKMCLSLRITALRLKREINGTAPSRRNFT
jgi:hypothetical protein